MKRKMLFSISLAVVLVVALAATGMAASSSVSISGPSSISTGDTISITISGDGEGMNGDVSTEGLSFVGVSGGFNCTQNVFIIGSSMGSLTATYTYTVTAGPGETASVSLSGIEAAENDVPVALPNTGWSATVPSGGSEQPTEEPPSDQTAAPSGDQSAAPSGSGSQGGSGNAGTTDKMPKTGDATMDLWTLAVIAAGCAGIAVFAGKKAFSAK